MKFFLIKLNWLLLQFGINLRTLISSFRGIPSYIIDFINFRKDYSGKINFYPCLSDRYAEAGDGRSEYFLQDLLVAKLVYEKKPIKLMDIGSRLDGFLAHLATFMNIDVFDIRPIKNDIPGIQFKIVDLMNPNESLYSENKYDSVSCLHTIEHFGLGRYADPINPSGYIVGLRNIVKFLEPNGIFYLSTPIGKERVDFNANRVFNPNTIIEILNTEGLTLEKAIILTQNSNYLEVNQEDLINYANENYNLGIFIFRKN